MAQSEATKPIGNRSSALRTPPALDPERLELAQPWRDYLNRGLITELTVKFTPGGKTIEVISVSDRVKLPEGVSAKCVAPGIVKDAIRASGLAPTRGDKGKVGGKKEQPLPARSLCVADMEEPDKLESRIRSVAEKISGSSAAGRIGSLKLYIEGVDTFEKWWRRAPYLSKIRILTDEKHFKSFTSAQLATLGEKLSGDCPFRGPVPTPSPEEESEAEPEEADTPAKEEKADKRRARDKKKGGKA